MENTIYRSLLTKVVLDVIKFLYPVLFKRISIQNVWLSVSSLNTCIRFTSLSYVKNEELNSSCLSKF